MRGDAARLYEKLHVQVLERQLDDGEWIRDEQDSLIR